MRPNEFVVEHPGHGGEWKAAVEDGFELRVAARDGVADDDEVGRGIEVGFREGLGDGDTEGAELVGHGRVGGLVGAGDAMALELKQAGERGHGGAADSDEVDVF